MRRLDLNANHKINFEEFCEAIEPMKLFVNAHKHRKHEKASPRSKQKCDYIDHSHSPMRNRSRSPKSPSRMSPLREEYDYDSPSKVKSVRK